MNSLFRGLLVIGMVNALLIACEDEGELGLSPMLRERTDMGSSTYEAGMEMRLADGTRSAGTSVEEMERAGTEPSDTELAGFQSAGTEEAGHEQGGMEIIDLDPNDMYLAGTSSAGEEIDLLCGDGICEGAEDCQTCSLDCGVCTESPNVVINEIVADAPDGGPDWIELANLGDQDADLSGWMIEDAGSNAATFPSLTIIPAGGYLRLVREVDFMFGLGSDDRITLLNTDRELIDIVDWSNDDAPEGTSWARIPDMTGGFETTNQPTPNATNQSISSPRCGDAVCQSGETCNSCPDDCGSCSTCPSTLFISEYIEGSSNNKIIEIFNATGAPVDLSEYEVWNITNGGVWPEIATPLNGILPNGATWVICNQRCDQSLSAVCDEYFPTDPVNFNGDDAVGLAHLENGFLSLVDQVGEDGGDVGQGWDVAGVSFATKNHTLVRAPAALPSTDWSRTSVSDWLVQDEDTFDDLGAHSFANLSCLTPQ